MGSAFKKYKLFGFSYSPYVELATALAKSKLVKQEVSRTVLLPTMMSGL